MGQAEALGADICPGLAAAGIRYNADGLVKGIAIGNMGNDKTASLNAGRPGRTIKHGICKYEYGVELTMDAGRYMLEQLRLNSEWHGGLAHDGHGRTDSSSRRENKNVDRIPRHPNAGLINRISEERTRGFSFGSIAATLNKEGVYGSCGARWYASSVCAFLHRHSKKR